ncbi:glycosyltransferase [Paracoccus laeviglucosivorans]|uniref:Glycosyltransferase involved in cell wall bisynthesis n=1 Tax=Paracoccus laeviglucosivorans TaxID=1197861 RepID=A0A521FQL5_9RHOB|nr:glycosyltransferase [Paracoccus laeviglucosivorans]SMO97830.1 Glycosyltransferase involved in cell wall bisynthesis [Paracoccus laeviglucosivorans]
MSRTVIVSHSHPNLRYGGGEVAAYRQFEHLLSLGQDVYFVGSTIGPEDSAKFFGASQQIVSFGPRDFCLRGRGMDSFTMEHAEILDEDWIFEFLLALKGDIYHFHHFWNIGAGTIRRLRAALPDAKFICTLHELTAICANHGQMVKRSGELCYASSEVACAACVVRAPIDFVLRKTRMLEMLDLFDHLLSPSEFLRLRFEDWGVAEGRIAVIENGLDHVGHFRPETEAELLAKSGRFAFFGQATPTKGLDVLIRAAALIEARDDEFDIPLSIEIHGVDKDSFSRMWPDLEIPSSIHFRGRYRPQDCVDIMRGYGWIIIPSVWWENSPVVIQEARAAGTPMIASDIGGMAEKTEGWGLQFRVADPAALASAILSVHGDVKVLADHKSRISAPLDLAGFWEEWKTATGLDQGKKQTRRIRA